MVFSFGQVGGVTKGMPMQDRWPVWKLALLLYVFATGAVAINLFMLALMLQTIGFPALSPVRTLTIAAPLGIPAAWAAGLWVRHLLDQASEP